MAIELKQTINAAWNGSNLTFPSWTPLANELVLVFITVHQESDSPSVAGNGLTFVSVLNIDNALGKHGINVFRAMGASPSAGTIVVTGLTVNAVGVACRFGGVDTGGTNGSSAVEVSASNTGEDSRNLQAAITTLTNTAWAIGVGSHRNKTFTVPAAETIISINNRSSLAGGTSTVSCSVWYHEQAVAAATTVGGALVINQPTEWTAGALSIKPASVTTPVVPPAVGVGTDRVVPTVRRGRLFSANDLTLLVRSPVWQGNYAVGNYTQDMKSYGHSSTAMGGFWSASVDLRLPLSELEDWRLNGLGRHISVQGHGTTIAWEGLVNQVTIAYGGFSQVLGPFLDIRNHVKMIYSMFIDLGGGAATGIRMQTDYLDDDESIARYGTLGNVFSSGGIATTEVDSVLALLLDRYRHPPRAEDLNIPGDTGANQFDLKLDCVGYSRLLDRYPYNSTVTGLTGLSDKIIAILDSDPNGLFTARSIQTNTLQVPAWENDDAVAWSILKDLVAKGDSLQRRYTFGVYENRTAYYAPVDDEIFYTRPLREGASVIQDRQGGLLQPWEVRPGSYMRVADLLPGKPIDVDLNSDSNAIFVETVQFRAPDSLVVNGSHNFKIEQRLAQLGLGGIS